MKRKDLLTSLGILLPGVEENNLAVEGADHFRFLKGWISSGNDKFSLAAPFKGDVEIEGGVKAKEFFQIIKKIKEEDIDVKVEDGNLAVTSESTELTMSLLEDFNNAMADLDTDMDWEDLPEDFLEGMRLAQFSTSNSSLHPQLKAVCVSGSGIYSTDNFRAFSFLLDEDMPDFVLSLETVRELLKLPVMKYSLESKKNRIHFKTETGLIFSARFMDVFSGEEEEGTALASFPLTGLQELLSSMEGEDSSCQFPEMIESLELAEILSSEDEESHQDYVSIYREGKFLLVKGARSSGSVTQKIPVDKSFPKNFNINIAPEFLKAILKLTRNFSEANGMIYFETEKFRHIISTI